MKVFILGGTGFIGYHTTKTLLQHGHQVATLALPPAPPVGLFPDEVCLSLNDFNALKDEDVLALLSGSQGAVFAGGVDDRVTPKAPAYPFFHRMNVLSAARFFRLAAQAGIKRGVLLSSYFAHFDQAWPELQLSKRHPYIRSRVEQEAAVLDAAGSQLEVMILQLPYIFGAVSGRAPLWKPVIDALQWPFPWVFYTQGGSAMVGVDQVAAAICGGLERGEAKQRYLIGDENLTWRDWLRRLMRISEKEKPVATLPNWLVGLGLAGVKVLHKLRGLEGGLDPIQFVRLQTRKTFFDPKPAQQALGFSGGTLEQSFKTTVRACGY
jgi:dihydroflavonol-4-reductase